MQIGLAASKLNSTAGANLNQEMGLAASKLNGTASQSAGGCSCYLCNRQSLQSGYCSAKQSQAGQACWNNRESPGCYSSLDWNPCKCAGGVAQPRVSGSPPEGGGGGGDGDGTTYVFGEFMKYINAKPTTPSSSNIFRTAIYDQDSTFPIKGYFLGKEYSIGNCLLDPVNLASTSARTGAATGVAGAGVTIPAATKVTLNKIATRSGGAIKQAWIAGAFRFLQEGLGMAEDVIPGTGLLGMALDLVEVGLELGNQNDGILETVADPNDLIDANFKEMQKQMGQMQTRMYNHIETRMQKMSTYVDNKVQAAQVQTVMTGKVGEYMAMVGSWENAMQLVLATRHGGFSFGDEWNTLLVTMYNQIVGSFSSFTLQGTELADNVLLLSESIFQFVDYMKLVNAVTVEMLNTKLIAVGATKPGATLSTVNLGETTPILLGVLATYKSTLTNAIAYAKNAMDKVLEGYNKQLYPVPPLATYMPYPGTSGAKRLAYGSVCGTVQAMDGLDATTGTAELRDKCLATVTMKAHTDGGCVLNGYFFWSDSTQKCGCSTQAGIDCSNSVNYKSSQDYDLYSWPMPTAAQEALKTEVTVSGNQAYVSVAANKKCTLKHDNTNMPDPDIFQFVGAAEMGRYIVASLQFQMYAVLTPELTAWEELLNMTTGALTELQASQ